MVTRRGFLGILQMADSGEPKHFVDFTMILVKNKRISSATVAKRLKELIALGAITEVISRSERGRRMITYKTTEKGRRLIELGNEVLKATALPKGHET